MEQFVVTHKPECFRHMIFHWCDTIFVRRFFQCEKVLLIHIKLMCSDKTTNGVSKAHGNCSNCSVHLSICLFDCNLLFIFVYGVEQ